MKKVTTTRTVTQYSDRCPICKKFIKGYSESQVNYNMSVHNYSKHLDISKQTRKVLDGIYRRKLKGGEKNEKKE